MTDTEIHSERALEQIEKFKKGFCPIKLSRPCTVGDGIVKLSPTRCDELIGLFERYPGSISKFVPASGAATRMFRDLIAFTKNQNLDSTTDLFFKNLRSFAFYDDLANAFYKLSGYSIEQALDKESYSEIAMVLLGKHGLNYSSLPKGLIKFHRHSDGPRMSSQEHLAEGYALGNMAKTVHVHFTVPEIHYDLFRKSLEEAYTSSSNEKVRVSFSVQDPFTDTIAVDLENEPIRDESGALVFRPAGHGALLLNLNKMEEDLVFIKNVDNILPETNQQESIQYKKILAGLLLSYQEKIFDLLRRHDQGEAIEGLAEPLLAELGLTDITDKNQLVSMLNRPLRVCGMVKNEGEPGGGPFWVENQDGAVTLQIVELAQIEKENTNQLGILNESTHFNPVDLVCGLKNYKGEKFDLMKYRDDQAGFISEKSLEGKKLKAMELPGLWNGSMSDWNTIFAEIPLSTFSPVKTVNDLLKKEHLS